MATMLRCRGRCGELKHHTSFAWRVAGKRRQRICKVCRGRASRRKVAGLGEVCYEVSEGASALATWLRLRARREAPIDLRGYGEGRIE